MDLTLFSRNRNYAKLFAASGVSNLGDGISALAFPWLASLITRDPFLISLTAAATSLPWLLFSLPAGVITDRTDRLRLIVRADLFRCLVTFGIVALILSGPALPLENGNPGAMIAALCTLAFLLGAAEVLRDNAAQTLLPSVVESSDLENANGQIWSIEQIMGQFVGPPLAGVLIALAVWVPFGFDAVTFALAAALVGMMAIPHSDVTKLRDSAWSDFQAGVTWLWAHRPILTLAVILGLLNASHMGAFAMLVLFSQEVLRLGAVEYGLLLAIGAAGGVTGGLIAPAIITRVGGMGAIFLALALFITAYLAISVTSSPLVVGAALFLETLGALIWNVFTVSYRQRVIPDDILGRVNSIYRFFGWGMIPLGALAGGLLVASTEPTLGREMALRAPFVVGAGLILCVAVFAVFRLRLPDAS